MTCTIINHFGFCRGTYLKCMMTDVQKKTFCNLVLNSINCVYCNVSGRTRIYSKLKSVVTMDTCVLLYPAD